MIYVITFLFIKNYRPIEMYWQFGKMYEDGIIVKVEWIMFKEGWTIVYNKDWLV